MVEERPDSAFLDWFAGFAAGEGCFSLHEDEKRISWSATFSIELRDDDLPILLEIQERLEMGIIFRRPAREGRRGNPQASFKVFRIGDLARLVMIFEQHPLRNKKQFAFDTWSRAVREIAKGRRPAIGVPTSYDRRRLLYLRGKLHLLNSYETMPASEDEGPLQLEFWSDTEENEEK